MHRLFVNTVKRLRIMKGSEQVNLGEVGSVMILVWVCGW